MQSRTALSDDLKALINSPLHELSDLSLSKLRMFLLSKNREIQAEMDSREEEQENLD